MQLRRQFSWSERIAARAPPHLQNDPDCETRSNYLAREPIERQWNAPSTTSSSD